MKINITFRLTLILVLFLFAFSGCVKDTNEPEEETTTPITPPPAKFTWTINGGTSVSADEMYFVSQYSNIYGSKSAGRNVDIILEDLSPGTHIISPSNGVTLDYFDGTITLSGTSGSVIITENTGTLISGSFTSSLKGGGATSTIKGDFSFLPKK